MTGCNIIQMPIKRKWFDMIAGDVKKEEYRISNPYKPYWSSRVRKAIDFVERTNMALYICFSNGYSKDAPKIICEVESIYKVLPAEYVKSMNKLEFAYDRLYGKENDLVLSEEWGWEISRKWVDRDNEYYVFIITYLGNVKELGGL